ncbi:uncharacterized protein N7483_005493 [Penicillium malachiteum]|uniref:uncharacterized protein n=1 Tax=Penicillium malachiteum TaxID=1324776 RepID=UPI002546DE57|nr:uncharacterized protein N7483_005493 [Penicillium malachiteum]KAJ5730985.1 hypothetical protein N7483_005493 [Penicillium malachiteum]
MADTIRTLAAQYFQLVDPPHLSLPPDNVLLRPEVQTALYEHMFDESLTPLPPPTYRTRILKLLIARIENAIIDPEEDEILDDLMSCWGTLLAQPKPSAIEAAQQLSHVKYTAPLQTQSPANSTQPPSPSSTSESTISSERTVITVESRGVILSGGTTGNRTWEAALHLGSFLASPAGKALVHGKRVIELGAGTGFISLFCARHLGVRSVVATDREPVLIENMRECVRLNSGSGYKNSESVFADKGLIPMYPAIWDWGTPLQKTDDMSSLGDDEALQFDVALGADLIYDTDLVPLLLSTVRDLFENYGVEQFIIASTVRNENTFNTFLRGCETNEFKAEHLPFKSTASEEQTGFFHSTSIPIRTYRISRA